MKYFLFLLLLACQTLPAQDSVSIRGRKAVVKLMDSKHTVNGRLEGTGDTALVMVIPNSGQNTDTDSLLIIPASRILSITLYKRRSVGAGIGRGALIGFFPGGFLGFVSHSASEKDGEMVVIPPEVAALTVGLIGALTGLIVGAIAPGHSRETIPI